MRQRAFGYTDEDLRMLMLPMAVNGEEPIGSMGTDTPLACLSDKPQPLFNYFKQLFAQVTNPPIDPIREELVMSLTSYIGTERNILDETPQHCHTLKLEHPILTNRDLEKLRRVSQGDFLATTLPTLFRVDGGEKELERALDGLCKRASLAIKAGYTLLILSDRGVDEDFAPIPSLLALTAVHNHLVREGTRTQVALIVESGEPREVHALLPADRLRRQRRESVPGHRDAGGSGAARAAARRRHLRQGAQELQEGHQQGPAEGLLEDGHLDAAELSRRADLRGHRPEQSSWSTSTSPAPPSRIEGVGLDVLAREAQDEARLRLPAASPSPTPSSPSAATISTASAASITCSIR